MKTQSRCVRIATSCEARDFLRCAGWCLPDDELDTMLVNQLKTSISALQQFAWVVGTGTDIRSRRGSQRLIVRSCHSRHKARRDGRKNKMELANALRHSMSVHML